MGAPLILQEPYRRLLEAHHLDPIQVYTPVSLLLMDAGFILPAQEQPARLEDGTLPPKAYRRDYETTDSATSRRFAVHLEGSPSLGMPYGGDSDIWLGISRLVDQSVGSPVGVVGEPSWGRLWAAQGRTRRPSAEDIARMRLALRRMAKVTIESELVYDPVQLSLEIEDGRRHPLVPRSLSLATQLGDRSRTRVKIHSVLEFEEDYISKDPNSVTGSTLVKLRLHEVIAHTLRVGWLSWIDVPTHVGLGRMTAKGLYQMCARLASRGKTPPYDFDFHADLRPGLMLSENRRPNKQMAELEAAVDELIEAGVVTQKKVVRTGAGPSTRYRMLLWPGERLLAARRLRGVSLDDTIENRALMMCLGVWGLEGDTAREAIATHPDTVFNATLYLAYSKHVAQKPVDNPAGFIRHALQKGASWSEEGFIRWMGSLGLTHRLPSDPAQLTLASAPDVPAPPRLEPEEPYRIAGAEPEAEHLLDALRAAMGPEHKVVHAYLLRLGGRSVEGDALVCEAAADIFKTRLEANRTLITAALSELTDDEVTRLSIELPDDATSPHPG